MNGQIEKIVLSEYEDYLIVPQIPEHCRGRDGAFDIVDVEVKGGIYRDVIKHSCGGSFKLSELSEAFKVLSCNRCCSRVIFPAEIEDYYTLAEFIKAKLETKLGGVPLEFREV